MDRDHYRCDKGEQGNSHFLLMLGSETKVNSMTALRGLSRFLGNLVFLTLGMEIAVFGICHTFVAIFDPQALVMDYFFVAPSYCVPVLFGLLFGHRFGWRLGPWSSRAVCLPPFALMAYALLTNHQASRHWSEVWAQFFSPICMGQECYIHYSSQVLVTAPLLASLGYIVGSEFCRRSRSHFGVPVASARWTWGRLVSVGLFIVCLFVMWKFQSIAQKDIAIKFNWSDASGFNSASMEYLPSSRLLRTVTTLPNESILLQTKGRIAYEMRSFQRKEASGCVFPVTLAHLPIVIGLDHLSDTSCTVTVR
jgi:hypothetical protein